MIYILKLVQFLFVHEPLSSSKLGHVLLHKGGKRKKKGGKRRKGKGEEEKEEKGEEKRRKGGEKEKGGKFELPERVEKTNNSTETRVCILND
jgi:hypothetical protein